ncbi:hypothetical protein F4778DRAFT_748150 [Xylariomycetidae sp. FL2044]|nr:hypothetical protein F4778DRAFT_748150 [Xylariomycetidae sp. FL2044]
MGPRIRKGLKIGGGLFTLGATAYVTNFAYKNYYQIMLNTGASMHTSCQSPLSRTDPIWHSQPYKTFFGPFYWRSRARTHFPCSMDCTITLPLGMVREACREHPGDLTIAMYTGVWNLLGDRVLFYSSPAASGLLSYQQLHLAVAVKTPFSMNHFNPLLLEDKKAPGTQANYGDTPAPENIGTRVEMITQTEVPRALETASQEGNTIALRRQWWTKESKVKYQELWYVSAEVDEARGVVELGIRVGASGPKMLRSKEFEDAVRGVLTVAAMNLISESGRAQAAIVWNPSVRK